MPVIARRSKHKYLYLQKWITGFTTTELIVVIAISTILTTLALPNFTLLIESWRVKQATGNLQSSLHYAKSEAIKRGGFVAMQKIPNNTGSCKSASGNRDWDCGWLICHDSNSNGSCDAAEAVLQRVDAPSNVQITRTGGGNSIKLNRWGLVDGTWLGFSLIPLDKSISHPGSRGVCMSSGGRITIIPTEAIPCRG